MNLQICTQKIKKYFQLKYKIIHQFKVSEEKLVIRNKLKELINLYKISVILENLIDQREDSQRGKNLQAKLLLAQIRKL